MPSGRHFLLTPRWLGYFALTVAAAVVMALLGTWQFHRYEQRSAINARIDAAATSEPVSIESVLSPPTGAAGTAGPPPADDKTWLRVSLTGRYDPANEVLVRLRTVEGRVGFEVLTPLVLADGAAVLVDRGWIPPQPQSPTLPAAVPAPPAGTVTVVGRVHAPESRAGGVERVDGRLQARRISPAALAGPMPYPIYGAYVTEEPARDGFVTIEPRRENAWQNGGYTIQWWLLAALTFVGFGYLARREAKGDQRPDRETVNA
jgi:cytochrome oxidase assembly protein ShyY1